jgi:DNA topoisomerase II
MINKRLMISHTAQALSESLTNVPAVKPKFKLKKKSDTSTMKSSVSSKKTGKATAVVKKASDIYKKMEHAEHILEKPDTYTGSTEQEIADLFVYHSESSSIQLKQISISPGLYKCFDELLVNAHDHKQRMMKIQGDGGKHHLVGVIKIDILPDGSISFYNDGDGILIEYMEEHGMYPPELIFGSLLTSTNYDDNEEREWGGRNGYGAKLANIFSTTFTVETTCHINKKKFKQEFTNNMTSRTSPTITSYQGKPYTKITWLPDYARFGMTNLNDSVRSLIEKRTYDIAGITDKDTEVYLNGTLISLPSFEKYVSLYIGDPLDTRRVFEEGFGWQIIATSSRDDIFEQVSFVNGINTSRGGTHVDYIADQIKLKLADYIKKKKKIDVKPQIVKNQLRLFINATKIINPVFDSQTKETLKTPKTKFGNHIEISDKFISQLIKTDIFDKIQAQAAFKDSQMLSKTDGKKSKRVRVNKLSDANKAGTVDSKKCTIIFTEGDSAKTMAISGLAEVGRDYYGVYPLRGKILNVRDAPAQQVLNCSVLNDIKKIIGLQVNSDYAAQYKKTGVWPLRYGQIMIMTDQDHDGSHIKGLVMNIFDSMWPNLIELGFITSMITPIVKAFKQKIEKVFYTLQDYEKWKQTSNTKGFRIKYYKGLGTSTTKEAKTYFKQLKVITYTPSIPPPPIPEIQLNNPDSSLLSPPPPGPHLNQLDMAFNKKRADHRKEWLSNYNKEDIPDYNKKNVCVDEFVDSELIHFSNEDNDRSIPSIIDGLKPSQRKVMYGCFKRNLKNEIKVAQLSGYISEHAAYHHGEVSLENTIKNMAQDYVSANNLNYLEPIGQFGSRLMGGDDAAQSRYIFTKLSPLTRMVFNQEDDCLCKSLNDDGLTIEPQYYYPILPAILINGCTGIGTGFSTDSPKCNPIQLAKYIIAKINYTELPNLKPWYRGFTGKIDNIHPGSYITRGCMKQTHEGTIHITELPIGTWTEKYIEFLDRISVERGKETAKQFIRSYTDNSTETQVNIIVKINPLTIQKLMCKLGKDGFSELYNKLKLTSSISLSNMHLFNKECQIQKFATMEDIIEYWFPIRREIYVKRRDYLLKKLTKELDIIQYKVKFIEEIIQDTIVFKNIKKQVIIQSLMDKKYPKISLNDSTEKSYDYLLGMDLYKLTSEEIEELKKKRELKQLEHATLQNQTSDDLWITDLNNFMTHYSRNLIYYNKEHHIGTDTPPSHKKSTVKKSIRMKKK